MIDTGTPELWTHLRQFTAARIGLGRSGDALPTSAVLEFAVAHAAARDAVHHELDVVALAAGIAAMEHTSIAVASQATSRTEFLRRPDLGRRLAPASQAGLLDAAVSSAWDLALVLADGLSAVAVERHALPLVAGLLALLPGWRVAPLIIATQARVALGDEIGELLHAEFVAVLIGERPGLSAPDSLGIYLTRHPHRGCVDARRNCISNVRPQGLTPEVAALKLRFLLEGARRLGTTGVSLKDETDAAGRLISGT